MQSSAESPAHRDSVDARWQMEEEAARAATITQATTAARNMMALGSGSEC